MLYKVLCICANISIESLVKVVFETKLIICNAKARYIAHVLSKTARLIANKHQHSVVARQTDSSSIHESHSAQRAAADNDFITQSPAPAATVTSSLLLTQLPPRFPQFHFYQSTRQFQLHTKLVQQ